MNFDFRVLIILFSFSITSCNFYRFNSSKYLVSRPLGLRIKTIIVEELDKAVVDANKNNTYNSTKYYLDTSQTLKSIDLLKDTIANFYKKDRGKIDYSKRYTIKEIIKPNHLYVFYFKHKFKSLHSKRINFLFVKLLLDDKKNITNWEVVRQKKSNRNMIKRKKY